MEPTAQPDVVLYRDDILWVLLEGEKNPIAPSYPLRDQEVPVSRAQIFKKIAELTPFSSLDQKVFEGLFSHADGWQQARIAFLDKFQEAPLESNLDPEKLRELKEDKKATEKRQEFWHKTAQIKGEPTEDTKIVADKVVAEEIVRPAQEVSVAAGSIETRRVQTLNTIESHQAVPVNTLTFVEEVSQNRMENIGFRDWLRNPIGTFKKWWGGRGNNSNSNKLSGVGKTNELIKKQVVKKVASEISKKSWGMMLKKGAMALAAKLGIGAATGGVGAVALVVVDVAKKILNSEKLKNLASKLTLAAGAALLWLFLNPGAAIGAVVGSFVGSAFGPLGTAAGFATGAWVGFQLQGIASSILGIGGGGVPTVSASAVAPVASISVGAFTIPANVAGAISSVGSFLGGSWVAQLAVIGIGGGIGALLLSVTITLAAVLQQPEQQTGGNYEGPQNILTVKSTVVPEKLNNDSGAFVTYSIIVTSSSDKEANLSFSINEVLQNKNGNTGITAPTVIGSLPSKIAAGENLTINFNSYPVKVEYNDSDLVFTVRVTTGTEIQTASSLTRIGSPPVNNDQPFGYPASGNIVRFEDDLSHNGTFFNSSGSRYWVAGGMDIVNHGVNTPVYSTTNGQVIFSGFDYGEDGHNCTSPIPIVAPFKKCAVGGAVIVKSGNYIVSYLHLKETGLAKTSVTKGQIIGYMYEGQLPTSDAEHVHYQVLLNGANVPFGSSANDPTAPCTPYKILPEIATRKAVTQDGSGPFVCQ